MIKRQKIQKEDVVSECCICCCPWGNDGEHRIVSLPCGHLFGKNCIERWIKANKNCPSCKVRVKLNTIRPIFTSVVAVLDNSNYESMKKSYQLEREQKILMEAKVATLELKRRQDKTRMEEMEQQIHTLKACIAHPSETIDLIGGKKIEPSSIELVSSRSSSNTDMQCVAEVTVQNGRVFAFAEQGDIGIAGCAITGNQYGFTKFNVEHVHHTSIVKVHGSPVRDVKLNSDQNALALTTSHDKTLKVTSLVSDTVVLSFTMDKPGWSCAWDGTNSNVVYAGSTGGMIYQYDIRQTRESLQVLKMEIPQPVHSLIALPSKTKNSPQLLSGVFAGYTTWSNIDQFTIRSTFVKSTLPIVSLASTKQFVLTSTRNVGLYAKHNLYSAIDTNESSTLLHTFTNYRTPSVIARSSIWTTLQNDDTIVASGNECTKRLHLWSVNSGKCISTLGSTMDTIVDVQHSSTLRLLGAMTKHKVYLYR